MGGPGSSDTLRGATSPPSPFKLPVTYEIFAWKKFSAIAAFSERKHSAVLRRLGRKRGALFSEIYKERVLLTLRLALAKPCLFFSEKDID